MGGVERSRPLARRLGFGRGEGGEGACPAFSKAEQGYRGHAGDSLGDHRSKDPWHGHGSGRLDVLGVGLQN